MKLDQRIGGRAAPRRAAPRCAAAGRGGSLQIIDALINAIVERMKGAHLPDAVLGLAMRLNMEGEEPELTAQRG